MAAHDVHMAKSESDYPSRVRARVRAAIADHGLTASGLARSVGWTQSYMSHRLNGRRPFSVDDLVSIANALDIEPSTLTADREAVTAK